MEKDINQNPLISSFSLSYSTFPFSGKWLITFPEDFFPLQKVWDYLIFLRKRIEKKWENNVLFFRIHFARTGKNSVFIEGQRLTILIGDMNSDIFNEITKRMDLMWEWKPAQQIRKVCLGFFDSPKEPRWKTLTLPSNLLYLGMHLDHHGFEVSVGSINQDLTISADLIGFTLYEDIFPEIVRWWKEKKNFSGLTAIGGPMVTLAPFASVYHLPWGNLFIRGEAEVVFPKVLHAFNLHDLEELFKYTGFLFQVPGMIVISEFTTIHRLSPDDILPDSIRFDFCTSSQLQNGLEINLSRGCSRGCAFCSRIQGKSMRKVPYDKIQALIQSHRETLRHHHMNSPASVVININDDDILQDTSFVQAVGELIIRNQYSIWGIQTSMCSLIQRNGKIREPALMAVCNPQLYFSGQPLLWIGTDVFSPIRAVRLGKSIPSPEGMDHLLQRLQLSGVEHFHYWIASDPWSSWEEFIEEMIIITDFAQKYSRFHLLPHAPFLIPYPSTQIFQLIGKKDLAERVRVKQYLSTFGHAAFYPLIDKAESSWEQLNRLLKNESIVEDPQKGFIDQLRREEWRGAWHTILYFLKQERLRSENTNHVKIIERLKTCEAYAIEYLEKLA